MKLPVRSLIVVAVVGGLVALVISSFDDTPEPEEPRTEAPTPRPRPREVPPQDDRGLSEPVAAPAPTPAPTMAAQAKSNPASTSAQPNRPSLRDVAANRHMPPAGQPANPSAIPPSPTFESGDTDEQNAEEVAATNRASDLLREHMARLQAGVDAGTP